MRRLTGAGTLALLIVACDQGPVTPPPIQAPDTNIFQLSISEPVTLNGGDVVSANGGVGQVYVAFSDGDLPDAVSVRISNVSAGIAGNVEHPVTNGALDPVVIAGTVNDVLELRVTKLDGSTMLLRAAVPTKRPPRVIRTNPPRGRTDVAVNSRVRIVFSEPIDPATISSSTAGLLRIDQPVAGSFVFGGPPTLAVEFVPAEPLAGSTSYNFIVSSGVRDLSGDALAEPVNVDFITSAIAAPGNLLLTVITSGVDLDDSYAAQIEGAGFSALDTLSPEGVLAKSLSPGEYGVTLTDVARNCAVTGGATRDITIKTGAVVALNLEVVCTSVAGQPVTSQGIAFVSARNGTSQIYVISADGSGLQQLTTSGGPNYDPAWSPDGKRIAFISERSGVSEVYVMDADGSHVVKRTSDGYASKPAWSPDGRKLAYGTLCDGDGCIKVISADADGSAAIRVGHSRGFNALPAWSPDGSEIAFVSDWAAFDFVFDVYVTKADGSNIRQLISGWNFYPNLPNGQMQPAFFWHPAYARDGRLALLQHRPHFGTRDDPPFLEDVTLTLISATGVLAPVAPAGVISRFAAFMPQSFAWSPDGSSIAFTSGECTGAIGENCVYSIRITRADGTGQRTLITDAFSPTWR